MSSKKQFDYIEDKIKQAAENNQPPFDDGAWKLMEAKLDKEEKKRRPLFWWFVLPLLIVGAWAGYEIMRPSEKNTIVSTVNTSSQASEPKLSQEATNNTGEKTIVPVASETTNKDNKAVVENPPETDVKQTNNNLTSKQNNNENYIDDKNATTLNKTVSKSKISGNRRGKLNSRISNGEAGEDEVLNKKEEPAGLEAPENNDIDQNKPADKNEVVNNNPASNKIPADKKEAAEPSIVKKDDKTTSTVEKDVKAKEQAKEKNKGKNKGFYVLATGGADAGSTRFLLYKNSNTTPKYGAGVGYQFNKRWSVQTGFYAVNKKYVARPADYTIKPGSPMGAYPLEKINASNVIYEIPLFVRYNIISKQSFSLYAMAGASSYIMKKESYDCFYRYYNTMYEHIWQYKGNKHLFSTAILSFGIEKSIASKFSVLLEPSFAVPLSGVGDGKIKLYSTALQAGVKYSF